MSLTSTRAAIEKLFQDNWVTDVDVARTPIKFEDVPFSTVARYVALNVRRTSARQMSIGNPMLERMRGMVTLEIFTEADLGAQVLDILGDYALRIFRGVQIRRNNTLISFETGWMINPGRRNGYMQGNIIIPFDSDELFALIGQPVGSLVTFDNEVLTFDNETVTF